MYRLLFVLIFFFFCSCSEDAYEKSYEKSETFTNQILAKDFNNGNVVVGLFTISSSRTWLDWDENGYYNYDEEIRYASTTLRFENKTSSTVTFEFSVNGDSLYYPDTVFECPPYTTINFGEISNNFFIERDLYLYITSDVYYMIAANG
jgi:hypothetical protein